jgi:hypothetical protein
VPGFVAVIVKLDRAVDPSPEIGSRVGAEGDEPVAVVDDYWTQLVIVHGCAAKTPSKLQVYQ